MTISRKRSNQFKVFLKNEYIFLRLLATNYRFSNELGKIFTVFNPSKGLTDLKLSEPVHLCFIKENEIRSEAIKKLSRWSAEKASLFESKINILLNRYGWGQEWFTTLVLLVLTQKLCPPRFNLHIDNGFNRLYSKRVILILNPDTSIEDLKDNWTEIQTLQEVLWPDFKKTNLNKKRFSNLLTHLETEHSRHNLGDEEKYPGLGYYERTMAKAGKYAEMVKQRKLSKEKVKPLKIKNKKTYKEIVRELTLIRNKETLKKEANKLSQLKRRISNKV